MAVKFERKDDRVTVAFLKCAREDIRGKRFTSLTATRAIKERDGWRIDRADAVASTWTPWEPITSDTYQTLAAAKMAIRAFDKICRLTPGSPERKQYGLSRAALHDRKAKGLQSRPLVDRPLAVRGLVSYRLRGPYGYIMIGARDHDDAMREAARSTRNPNRTDLEVWNGDRYVKAFGKGAKPSRARRRQR